MSLQLELLKTKSLVESVYIVLLSVLFSLTSIGLMITFLNIFNLNVDLGELYQHSVRDIFGTSDTARTRQAEVLFWTVPLVLTGLSVALAFQAGLFNIGGQGQLMVGGGFAAIWSIIIMPGNHLYETIYSWDLGLFTFRFTLNHPAFMIPSTMLVGFIGGAIWGFVPGLLKAKYGAHEVITTILMNIIAISLLNYWFTSPTYSPYVDRSRIDAYGQSEIIPKSAVIQPINRNISNSLNYSIFFVIVIVIVFYYIIFKSNLGFKIRAVGLNEVAARTSGINSSQITILAMMLSGGVAGLAGALMVQGNPPYRYINGMESTFGFDGIAIALIGQNNPIGVGIAALFFGFLKWSRLNLDVETNIPSELIVTFQAFIILFAAAPLIAKKVLNRFDDLREGEVTHIEEVSK